MQAVLTLRFGDEKSLFGQAATADAVARLLDKGSATLTRQQVQDRLDALKTEMSIHGAPGQVSVSLSSRREHLAEAVALAAELLRRPALPADAFEEYKRQSLTRIEAQRKEPGAVAANALARLGNPYPRGDVRYARTFDEQLQDLNALTLEQLRAFHTRFYGARFAQFGAAGDIDVPALQRALQAGFGDWNAGEPFTRVPQPLLAAKGEALRLITPDKQNADLRVRQPVPLADTDADYPALTLANHLLGSGGSSRLWKRIRETDGLSYSVHSHIAWNNFEPNSSWLASAIFAPQNRAKVESALREEIARALKDGFSAQELDEGRSGLLSFRRLSRAQDDVLASQLAIQPVPGPHVRDLGARRCGAGRADARAGERGAAQVPQARGLRHGVRRRLQALSTAHRSGIIDRSCTGAASMISPEAHITRYQRWLHDTRGLRFDTTTRCGAGRSTTCRPSGLRSGTTSASSRRHPIRRCWSTR